MNNDGLPGAGDIDLTGPGNIEILQVALELRIVCLKVEEGLR